ncbi:MAG: hypothetical protein HS115_16840 [Spirochaetales bacterium]|nr:hypothetical protein [Spirochaetales bacterium]
MCRWLLGLLIPVVLFAGDPGHPESEPDMEMDADHSKARVFYPYPDMPLLHSPMQAARRIGVELSYFDYIRKSATRKESAATIYGEYQWESLSLFMSAPYRRLSESGVQPRIHFDNVRLGLLLSPTAGRFLGHYCLVAAFTTGREARGIGSEFLGNVEACTGFAIQAGLFRFRARIRYNSQTNLEFAETKKRKFQRTWYGELGFELHFERVIFSLELTRVARVAQKKDRFHTTLVAPGLVWRVLPEWSMGLAVPLTTSRERRYDRGLIFKSTYYF